MRKNFSHSVFSKLPYVVLVLGAGVLLSWLFRFFFSPAVPYEFLRPTDQIEKIQIARIMEDLDLYQYPVSETFSMLDDATFTISTVKPEHLGTFLEDFSQVPCYQWANDPIPHLRDKALLITYQDGSVEWVCADGTFYWDNTSSEAGMTWFYFDTEAFSNMLTTCRQLT